MNFIKSFFLLTSLIIVQLPAMASPVYQPVSVLNSTTVGSPVFLDGYGQTVKLNDDYLFVAAPFARPSGPADVVSGAIYVYHHVGDQYINTQIIETMGEGDHDGALEIEAQGKWLMFSALGTPIGPIPNDVTANQDFKGSVQIYQLDEASSQYKFVQSLDSNTPGLQNLTPTVLAALNPFLPFFLNQQGASFGLHFSLDANSGNLLVGAEYQQNIDSNNNPLINSGALYAFKLNKKTNSWDLIQAMTNPDGVSANDSFGYNVRVNNNIALVSNGPFFQGPKFGPIAANSAVYVYQFTNNAWSFVQKLSGDQSTLPIASVLPVPGATPFPIGDSFGASLALSDKWAIIGAPLESKDPNNETTSGAVYFYKLTYDNGNPSFVKQQKVFSDDPLSYLTGFIFIDIDGKTAVICDPGRSGPNSDYQGGVMVFRLKNDTWQQIDTLVDPNGGLNSFFGGSVSIKGNTIAVGGIPFAAMAPVAFENSYIGPPFHHSLLLPIFPVPATPVIIYNKIDTSED